MLKKLSFSILITFSFFSLIRAATNDSIVKLYQPKAGDWAIGLDATPYFRYAGNLFSQNGNPYVPSIQFNAQYPSSIYMKFKTWNNNAIRGIFTIGVTHEVDNIINITDEANPHQLINSALNIGGIIGYEFNKSINNRLAAFYGIQAGIQRIPYNDGSNAGTIEYIDQNDEESYFKEYGGNAVTLLASTFVGFEFFLFPKFALSGEIDLGFSSRFQNERFRQRGSDEAEIIDEKRTNISLRPGTSGNIGIFMYF